MNLTEHLREVHRLSLQTVGVLVKDEAHLHDLDHTYGGAVHPHEK